MKPIVLNTAEYRDKVLACWLGKNIGGTLGAPMEWRRQVNNVSFYTQDLHGEPLPNDDLDIQLLWLVALEERGINLNARQLADYWCTFVTPHWAEYGIAKANLRAGLVPPLSGSVNNKYKHSCGAFIRSEIWACIAPGCPGLAARFAYEDAIIDHGNGEGTFAEIFCAALESAAFVVSDIHKLIEIGLSYIPTECGTARAVRATVQACGQKKPWLEVRDLILRDFRGSSFFNIPEQTSPEDRKKGFHEGEMGYDAPSNIAILVLGLLTEGDFGQKMCTTVNCGEDTDCTGATVGSIFGLMHGTKGIPQKWIDPIGRGIKTACLNLGELGYFGNQLPQNVDDLTARTEKIARQVLLRHKRYGVELADAAPTDLSSVQPTALNAKPNDLWFLSQLNGPVYQFDYFTVAVDCGETPCIKSNIPQAIRITLDNRYSIQANLAHAGRYRLAGAWGRQPTPWSCPSPDIG
jgi:ADP-ribosylglycohydrolase